MRSIWGTIILLAALTGCSAAPAPPVQTPVQPPAQTPSASATQDKDAAFRLALKGRFPGNLADAPVMARTICDDFRTGTTFTAELLHLQGLVPSLAAGDVGYLIDTSTSTYCPGLNPH